MHCKKRKKFYTKHCSKTNTLRYWFLLLRIRKLYFIGKLTFSLKYGPMIHLSQLFSILLYKLWYYRKSSWWELYRQNHYQEFIKFQEVSEEVEDQDYKSTGRLIAWQIFWGIFPVHFQILGRIYVDDCFLVKVSFYWNYFVIYFDLIQKRLKIFMFLFVELLNLECFS